MFTSNLVKADPRNVPSRRKPSLRPGVRHPKSKVCQYAELEGAVEEDALIPLSLLENHRLFRLEGIS